MIAVALFMLASATAAPDAAPVDPAAQFDPIVQAILRNGEGATVIEFSVDVSGHVMQCTVAESSGSEELDQAACGQILGKAKFVRWQGPERNKVRNYRTRILWRITE